MVNTKSLKLKARRDLRGNYATLIGAYILFMIFMIFIISLFTIISSFITIGAIGLVRDHMDYTYVGIIIRAGLQLIIQLIIYLFTAFLIPGFIKMHFKVCNGERATLNELKYGFNKYFYKYLVVGLLICLAEVVLILPMASIMLACIISENVTYIIIGGVVSAIITIILMLWVYTTYSQTYIILTDKNCGIFEALKTSRIIMQGHKLSYIYLNLSFIGINILAALSYVGMLWACPYYVCTLINFYKELNEEQNI